VITTWEKGGRECRSQRYRSGSRLVMNREDKEDARKARAEKKVNRTK